MSAIELWTTAVLHIEAIERKVVVASTIPPVYIVQELLDEVRAANTALQSLERQLVGVLPPKEG